MVKDERRLDRKIVKQRLDKKIKKGLGWSKHAALTREHQVDVVEIVAENRPTRAFFSVDSNVWRKRVSKGIAHIHISPWRITLTGCICLLVNLSNLHTDFHEVKKERRYSSCFHVVQLL
jgi:hypothetical protein